MSDPIGLVSHINDIPRELPPIPGGQGKVQGDGEFRDMLADQIRQVNNLQQQAKEATEDLAAGRRNDLETVMIATEKADTAFRMLLAMRNKVMEAYDEVKQLRV